MFFSHFLFVLAASLTTFFHPASQVPNPSQTHVLAAQTIKKETVTPSPIPSPTPTIPQLASPIPQQQLIDCLGPDGKHLHVTQKSCDEFNTAWHNTTIIPTSPYGQATKIANHTYELQLPPDDHMASVQEVLSALNIFRQQHGVNPLIWSATLTSYAQSRADFYASQHALDEHAGFMDFINNQDGFAKLGFNHLGENASYAGPLSGTHLIEWVFAADQEHNDNQLNKDWTHVGIGIQDIATDIIFASSPR